MPIEKNCRTSCRLVKHDALTPDVVILRNDCSSNVKCSSFLRPRQTGAGPYFAGVETKLANLVLLVLLDLQKQEEMPKKKNKGGGAGNIGVAAQAAAQAAAEIISAGAKIEATSSGFRSVYLV